ncbi:Slp family outer membrane lipoprotein [Klebsiella sp. SORGH_AS 1173]|nr:Slp family outer membrane lipoprotein [Klebsiella sp. SORGH_AS_1173]
MAGQKQGVRWLLAAAVAVALSGCVSVPDAIKGTSPTPQQDLVRVMNAPQLYVGQEARFGGKVVNVQNQQGKNPLRNRHRTAGQRRTACAGRTVSWADLCRR